MPTMAPVESPDDSGGNGVVDTEGEEDGDSDGVGAAEEEATAPASQKSIL
jgi:hypothetical protein